MGGILINTCPFCSSPAADVANYMELTNIAIGQSTLLLFFCLGSFSILGGIDGEIKGLLRSGRAHLFCLR